MAVTISSLLSHSTSLPPIKSTQRHAERIDKKAIVIIDLYPTPKGFKRDFGVHYPDAGLRFLSKKCLKYVESFATGPLNLGSRTTVYSPFKKPFSVEACFRQARASRMVVISGGPVDVNPTSKPTPFVGKQTELIKEFLHKVRRYNDLVAPNKAIKVVGICAGHQFIHHVFGGTVERRDSPACGVSRVHSPNFGEEGQGLNVVSANGYSVTRMGEGFKAVLEDVDKSDPHVVTMSRHFTTVQYHPERNLDSWVEGESAKGKSCCPEAVPPIDSNQFGALLGDLARSRNASTHGRVRQAFDGVVWREFRSGIPKPTLSTSSREQTFC